MNEQLLYTLHTTLEESDYKKFLYFTTFRKPLRIFSSFLIISLSATTFLSLFLNFSDFATVLGIFVCFIFISLGFLLLKINRLVKTLFSSTKEVSFKKEQTICLYPDHLTATNRMNEKETKKTYEELTEIVETVDLLIFFFQKDIASPVPKRDLAPEEYVEIRAFLKEKLGDRFTEA